MTALAASQGEYFMENYENTKDVDRELTLCLSQSVPGSLDEKWKNTKFWIRQEQNSEKSMKVGKMLGKDMNDILTEAKCLFSIHILFIFILKYFSLLHQNILVQLDCGKVFILDSYAAWDQIIVLDFAISALQT